MLLERSEKFEKGTEKSSRDLELKIHEIGSSPINIIPNLHDSIFGAVARVEKTKLEPLKFFSKKGI